jgi:Tat protein secretion system quality control protein TatD with DNase activity
MPPHDSVLAHIVDVHCHAGEFDNLNPQDMDNLKISICAMASNVSDQNRVRDLAERWPEKVIPAFGISIFILKVKQG